MMKHYSVWVAEHGGLWLELGALFVAGLLLSFIAKRFLLSLVEAAAKRTKSAWDDELVAAQVFSRLASFALPVVIFVGLRFLDEAASGSMAIDAATPSTALVIRIWVLRFLQVWMVWVGIRVIDALLNAVVSVWNHDEANRTRPIRAYAQVVKIIAWLFAVILAISFLMDQSPWALLGGLAGAMTILLLVFKDSIMGFVASVQLSNYDLVRVGDWIEVPSYGADGDVLEVSLHTVKVQNWDKTITTLPTTALVTGGFKNWRGMSESGGRRIKRSISLDMRSVKFVDETMLAKLKKINFIQEYLNRKVDEVGLWNKEQNIDESSLVNGRRLTNLGTFRAYIEFYLQNHPNISKEMTFLVRQLPPNEKGVPIQLYVFSTEKRWVQYEAIISDVFDHIIAVVPEFELRVFQNPTGADFHRLISAEKHE